MVSEYLTGVKGTVPPLYSVTNVAEPIFENGSLTAENAKIAEKNRRIRSKDIVKVSFSTSHFPVSHLLFFPLCSLRLRGEFSTLIFSMRGRRNK